MTWVRRCALPAFGLVAGAVLFVVLGCRQIDGISFP